VCSGRTGHTEVVLVAYGPAEVSYETLLPTVWEDPDPTPGMGPGNDVGTQYRSAIYVDGDDQREAAVASLKVFQERLTGAGYGEITTEIRDAAEAPFFYAEGYHQQYLAKNPEGECGLGGCGISFRTGAP